MAEETTLTVIREQVDANTTLQKIAGANGGVPVAIERSVLYPYIKYTARCTVPTLAGGKNLSIDCLVDGVSGLGATADAFSTEQALAGDELRMQARITVDEAQQSAQRTVTHRLGRQLKMIAPFDVRLEPAGTVYRRFWAIRVGDGRIMADSVTGNTHPLGTTAP